MPKNTPQRPGCLSAVSVAAGCSLRDQSEAQLEDPRSSTRSLLRIVWPVFQVNAAPKSYRFRQLLRENPILYCTASPDVTRQVFASVDLSSASLTKHATDLQFKFACDSSARLCGIKPTGCLCLPNRPGLAHGGSAYLSCRYGIGCCDAKAHCITKRVIHRTPMSSFAIFIFLRSVGGYFFDPKVS